MEERQVHIRPAFRANAQAVVPVATPDLRKRIRDCVGVRRQEPMQKGLAPETLAAQALGAERKNTSPTA